VYGVSDGKKENLLILEPLVAYVPKMKVSLFSTEPQSRDKNKCIGQQNTL
jgi:hypothetical protein